MRSQSPSQTPKMNPSQSNLLLDGETTSSPPDLLHELFTERLKKSQEAVLHMAAWHERRGFSVYVPPLRIAPSRDQWREFSDSGDFYVDGYGGKRRMEAKRLTKNFTCHADWPYKLVFIVCSKHSFDNADPKPRNYFILNPSMTHCGVVAVNSTVDDWTWRPVYDRKFLEWQDDYFCPMRLVYFMEL